MDRKHTKVKDLIREEFLRVKAQLGHRPSRMELFTLMDDDIYDLCRRNSAENIFRNYLPFLESLGRLMPEEKELYGGLGRDFLHLLETTSMTKVYKMPVLRAFYNDGDVRMAVTNEELLTEWKAFFGSGTNWRDLKPDGTYQDYLSISDKAHLSNLLSNPVHFLQKSGKGFFVSKEGCALAIREDLAEIARTSAFARQMGDIIDYRTMDYYQRRYHESCV